MGWKGAGPTRRREVVALAGPELGRSAGDKRQWRQSQVFDLRDTGGGRTWRNRRLAFQGGCWQGTGREKPGQLGTGEVSSACIFPGLAECTMTSLPLASAPAPSASPAGDPASHSLAVPVTGAIICQSPFPFSLPPHTLLTISIPAAAENPAGLGPSSSMASG